MYLTILVEPFRCRSPKHYRHAFDAKALLETVNQFYNVNINIQQSTAASKLEDIASHGVQW